MRFFVKAIATGFAMSMGSAIFKKVSEKMGLENEATKDDATAAKAEVASQDDDPTDCSDDTSE